jgi:hypothetical protein
MKAKEEEPTNIKEEELKEEELKEEELKEEELKEEELKETELKETELKEEQLKEEQLKETELKETELKETELKETELKETELKEEELKETELKEEELKETELKEEPTNIKETELKETELKETELKETELKETELKETELKETELKETELKEEEPNKTEIEVQDDYSYFQMIIDAHKLICMQVVSILLISLIYINCFDDNIYDFVIYFCFGIVISILLIASLVLIKKFNIISREKHYKMYSPYILDFCKKYINLNGENAAFYYALISCIAHLIFPVIAFLYAKKYIKTSKKSNNALLISLILFIAYTYVNIYVNDIFKVYTKSLELSNEEYKVSLFSMTLTYTGLVYYFETIKNEKAELINKITNKLINK